jgi:hypothetical protein
MVSSESSPAKASFNRDHSRQLYYGLHHPDQKAPEDWLPEHLDPEGNYPDSYTLEDLLLFSNSVENITLILDTIAQEITNAAQESFIDIFSIHLLEGAQRAASLQDVEAQYELADVIAGVISKGTVQVQVMLDYIQIIIQQEFKLPPEQRGSILSAQGRRWIQQARRGARQVEEGLIVKLPTCLNQIQEAITLLDKKKAYFTNMNDDDPTQEYL